MSDTFMIAAAVWVVCGVICLMIGQAKGHKDLVSWFFVGLIFGPIAVVLAVLAKPATR